MFSRFTTDTATAIFFCSFFFRLMILLPLCTKHYGLSRRAGLPPDGTGYTFIIRFLRNLRT